jgi:D-beta-D-heptose 7-phosphate kinase/D-beta-D-heptose 1-phosphate adenosyltransferase
MILDFSNANVLVFGDVMLDSYWQGATRRISPEAPVPVVHVSDQSSRIGGSGNVAMNVTSLGAQASLLALLGDDEAGRELQSLLQQSGIHNLTEIDPRIPTTTKLRVLSQHQQLIRLDFEKPHHEVDLTGLVAAFERALEDVGIVILSDYGKGLLNDAQPFIQLANARNVPLLVDPKKTDFENYSGAFLLTPNRQEFETVAGSWSSQDELADKAGRIIDECKLGGLLVTQGGDGMTLMMKGEGAQHFPAHAKEVYDVTGAGDTVIASLATGMASGLSVPDAVHLSCQAAGIVVGRVGTATVSVEDLQALEENTAIRKTPLDNKIHNQDTLLNKLEELRQQGQKIIFTNGCFDLLHAGHVRYLEQAAALGDVLIVAVNSDDSVRQLKGESRPINALQDRRQILAGLSSVDLVVGFSEPTPQKLICAIKPDVLVKGGDYSIDEIAGRECAGEVVLIDFVDGKSTTSIIQKISAAT